MASRDIILTALRCTTYESTIPFFESLKRTGYEGKVVVFASAMRDGGFEKLQKTGATILPFHIPSLNLRQPLAAPWGLWRAVFASPLPRAVRHRLAHMVFHMFYRRHLLYLDYLRAHRSDIDRVFLSDSRDVFFQAEPFSWNPAKGVHFFLEESSSHIGTCPHNSRWILHQFGQATLDELAGEVVSCAGTTFGDIDSILGYLETMESVAMKVRSLRDHDGDQGIHNYILRKKLLSGAVAHANRTGAVLTMGQMKMNDLKLGAQGEVLDEQGRVIPVLHQYDRLAELKQALHRGIGL